MVYFKRKSINIRYIKMNQSKQVEQISEIIQEKLKELSAFPKMYHPSEDLISIPLIIDNKKIIIEVKGIK